MRIYSILLLTVVILGSACDDQVEPSTTLLVSTSTAGEDPDQDGYLLMIDDVDSVAVDPTGEAEIDVEAGWHSLTLLGVADQCTVAPKPEIEVEVLGGSRTSVAFAVSCPATRAHVTVRTTGLTPDPDGYLLTIDNTDSLGLEPIATAAVDLAAGRHTLSLLDVSDRCSVAPGTVVEVNILPGTTTPVVFEVTCSTGASITVRTTGLDIDPDGYRLEVDGNDRGPIRANGTVLTALERGSWTITLTGLTPNCAFDGPGSRTVTIDRAELVPIEFSVVCTATTGVIRVVLSGALGLGFEGIVDGVSRFPIDDAGRGFFSGRGYAPGVPAGTHVVSLNAPADCSNEPGLQSVAVTAGDTVEITFSVTCVSGLRIITRTTGRGGWGNYFAVLCSDIYCDGLPFYIGRVGRNDTLVFKAGTDTYSVGLSGSRNCVKAQNPPNPIQFVGGSTVDVEFLVTCS